MITDTISFIEAIAFLVTFPGELSILYSIWLRYGDLLRLRQRSDFIPGGPRHIQAKGHIRTEIGKLSVAILYTILILFLMTVPGGDGSRSIGTFLLVGSILWSLVVMSGDSIWQLIDRTRIQEQLEQRDRNEGPLVAPPMSTLVMTSEDRGDLTFPINVVERKTNGH
jgi:hypothetical protein